MTSHSELEQQAHVVAALLAEYAAQLRRINATAEQLLILCEESEGLRFNHRYERLVTGLRSIYNESVLPQPLAKLVDLLSETLPAAPSSGEDDEAKREEVSK